MAQLQVFSTGIVRIYNKIIKLAPVAQLDRASDFGSEGSGFESLRAHHRFVLLPTH